MKIAVIRFVNYNRVCGKKFTRNIVSAICQMRQTLDIVFTNSNVYPNVFSCSSSRYTETHFLFLLSDIPADDILELFGKTFFEFCQDSGYDKILQVLGATPRDFLQVILINAI